MSKQASRQTRSYLMKRFEEVGIHPRSKLGQNFLIDLNLIEMIASSAFLEENDVVLEVGTGMGSLTGIMAKTAGHIITVELDTVLYDMAADELAEFDNIQQIQADILENKNRLNQGVLQAIHEALEARPGAKFKLVANLPYNVATPLMSNLLLTDHPPDLMSVTIQKELADRICARPRTKDYGALAIWMQAQCDVETVRVMAPTVFWPRPKVDSAIIRITRNERKRKRIKDLTFFHEFTRAMFFHRRKFLRSELISAFKKRITKEQVDKVMGSLDLKPTARAEELPVGTFLTLSERMRSLLPEGDTKIL